METGLGFIFQSFYWALFDRRFQWFLTDFSDWCYHRRKSSCLSLDTFFIWAFSLNWFNKAQGLSHTKRTARLSICRLVHWSESGAIYENRLALGIYRAWATQTSWDNPSPRTLPPKTIKETRILIRMCFQTLSDQAVNDSDLWGRQEKRRIPPWLLS